MCSEEKPFDVSECEVTVNLILSFPPLFSLQQKKTYLERSVKDAEDNIREMLMSRRAQ